MSLHPQYTKNKGSKDSWWAPFSLRPLQGPRNHPQRFAPVTLRNFSPPFPSLGSKFARPRGITSVVLSKLIQQRNRIAGSLLMSITTITSASSFDISSHWNNATPQQRVHIVNAMVVSGIFGWGSVHWGYGDHAAHAEQEHWFSATTKHGGADKLGHAYTSYALSEVLRAFYLSWDGPSRDAGIDAATSAMLIVGLMEVGDAFSDYGFSYEDMIMNAAGVALSYAASQNEKLQQKLSFRVEYSTLSDSDFFTDYEHMKFIAAVKLAGFEAKGLWQYLEIDIGYFARGYDENPHTSAQRNIFLGLGLNIPHVLRKAHQKTAATIFEFVQLPRSYVATEVFSAD